MSVSTGHMISNISLSVDDDHDDNESRIMTCLFIYLLQSSHCALRPHAHSNRRQT